MVWKRIQSVVVLLMLDFMFYEFSRHRRREANIFFTGLPFDTILIHFHPRPVLTSFLSKIQVNVILSPPTFIFQVDVYHQNSVLS